MPKRRVILELGSGNDLLKLVPGYLEIQGAVNGGGGTGYPRPAVDSPGLM